MTKWVLAVCLLLALTGVYTWQRKAPAATAAQPTAADKVVKTEVEWRQILPPQTFYVMRQQGTERAFSTSMYKNKETGAYYCAACDNPLFSSKHKYDSGTGWPSFWEVLDKQKIGTEIDNSLFASRTEVHCARCGGHLGHVFNDGPAPTGLRYCINSVSLKFQPLKR